MQKFWILETETFAWNSSHCRGSGPQTQTRTVDLFRIHLNSLMNNVSVSNQIYGFDDFFPRLFGSPLLKELILRTPCQCPKEIYGFAKFFPWHFGSHLF